MRGERSDTTAASIVWTVWLLGRYPEVQRRAQEEVDALYEQLEPGARPSMDALNRLKYVDNLLKESLRLYPSVPLIGRVRAPNKKKAFLRMHSHRGLVGADRRHCLGRPRSSKGPLRDHPDHGHQPPSRLLAQSRSL